jgi:hypothetical protein
LRPGNRNKKKTQAGSNDASVQMPFFHSDFGALCYSENSTGCNSLGTGLICHAGSGE